MRRWRPRASWREVRRRLVRRRKRRKLSRAKVERKVRPFAPSEECPRTDTEVSQATKSIWRRRRRRACCGSRGTTWSACARNASSMEKGRRRSLCTPCSSGCVFFYFSSTFDHPADDRFSARSGFRRLLRRRFLFPVDRLRRLERHRPRPQGDQDAGSRRNRLLRQLGRHAPPHARGPLVEPREAAHARVLKARRAGRGQRARLGESAAAGQGDRAGEVDEVGEGR